MSDNDSNTGKTQLSRMGISPQGIDWVKYSLVGFIILTLDSYINSQYDHRAFIDEVKSRCSSLKNDTAASRKCSICPGPHLMKVNFLRCNYEPCRDGEKYCGSSIQIRTCATNGKGFAVLDRKDGHCRRMNEEYRS
jgi:hypothetical protein